MSEPEITVQKASYTIAVSQAVFDSVTAFRDRLDELFRQAADPNFVPPKPWEGEPLTPKPATHLRLLEVTDGLVRELVELHGPKPDFVHPDGTVTSWVCDGCEFSGYDGERPDWPCETTAVIARHLGVSLEAA